MRLYENDGFESEYDRILKKYDRVLAQTQVT